MIATSVTTTLPAVTEWLRISRTFIHVESSAYCKTIACARCRFFPLRISLSVAVSQTSAGELFAGDQQADGEVQSCAFLAKVRGRKVDDVVLTRVARGRLNWTHAASARYACKCTGVGFWSAG
jgi:hypothetical protein